LKEFRLLAEYQNEQISKSKASLDDLNKEMESSYNDLRLLFPMELLLIKDKNGLTVDSVSRTQGLDKAIKEYKLGSKNRKDVTYHPVSISLSKDNQINNCLQYHGALNVMAKNRLEYLEIIPAQIELLPKKLPYIGNSTSDEAILSLAEGMEHKVLDVIEKYVVPSFIQKQLNDSDMEYFYKILDIQSYSQFLPKLLSFILAFVLMVTPFVLLFSLFYPPWSGGALMFTVMGVVYVKSLEIAFYLARVFVDVIAPLFSNRLLPIEEYLFYDFGLVIFQALLLLSIGLMFMKFTVKIVSMPTASIHKVEMKGSYEGIEKSIKSLLHKTRVISDKYQSKVKPPKEAMNTSAGKVSHMPSPSEFKETAENDNIQKTRYGPKPPVFTKK
jgi:hypothetical protein